MGNEYKPFENLRLEVKSPEKEDEDLQKAEDRSLFYQAVKEFSVQKKTHERKKSGFTFAERGITVMKEKRNHVESEEKKIGKNPIKVDAVDKRPVQQDILSTTASFSEVENEFLLWANRNASPLKHGGRMVIPALKKVKKDIPDEDFNSMLDKAPEFSLLNSDEYLEGYVAGLDEGILNRLREGQFGPEAHLDLHGLNSFQAFEAVREFIRASWYKGLRTILLVPGRGLNSPDGRGILRQKLSEWLPHDPFKRVVLAFCTAQPKDGGPGSFYVLLRTNRKKGHIYWERLPPDPDLFL